MPMSSDFSFFQSLVADVDGRSRSSESNVHRRSKLSSIYWVLDAAFINVEGLEVCCTRPSEGVAGYIYLVPRPYKSDLLSLLALSPSISPGVPSTNRPLPFTDVVSGLSQPCPPSSAVAVGLPQTLIGHGGGWRGKAGGTSWILDRLLGWRYCTLSASRFTSIGTTAA